jgi:hypothetical protein
MTLNEPSLFPPNLRKDIERICDSVEVRQACKEHTESPGWKILDIYFADQLASRGYSVKRDRLWVVEKSKFDLDLLINGPNWRVAILIEGGQAARIDLDLLKFIAWSKRETSADTSFAALIVSDKKLRRNITGTAGETAFDYLVRLRGLFSATGPKVADLLVVEYESSLKGSPQQKPISQGNQEQFLPITLEPSDPDLFKQELLISKKAEIEIVYSDGRVEQKQWNATRFTISSNVSRNLRSRPEFRSGNWQARSIQRVHVRVKKIPNNANPHGR